MRKYTKSDHLLTIDSACFGVAGDMARANLDDEFAKFGPWIDEVSTAEDLPRLYRGAGIDPTAHRLVLKVPRDIERRNAHPGMHLYDYLVAVAERDLTVLQRYGDGYLTLHLQLDEIAAIEDSVRLLDGRLTIHAMNGSAIRISYNSSAREPIQKLVLLLRRRYLPAASPVPQTPSAVRLGRGDGGLVSDYRRLTQLEPGFRLLGVAERQTAMPKAFFESLYRRIWPLMMQPTIMVTDDREIQIIHRRDWFMPKGDDISLARTVLPISRIERVTARDHERYLGIQVVTVQIDDARLEFPVPAGPATDRFLELAPRQQ